MGMVIKKKATKTKAVKKPAKTKAKVVKPKTVKAKAVKGRVAKPKAVKAKTTTKARAKAPAKKTVAVVAVKKRAPTVNSAYSKSELFATIAECAGVNKKDVVAVFDAFYDIVEQHIKRRGPQVFMLPGLAKIKVINKPATKARRGINPFTGEETTFKAKPARNVVKVLALKKLKDMAK